jgi:predicted RNA-binding Zn-ribbon protein involved in translation (DUF1610 family)
MQHKCPECGSERISPPVPVASAGAAGLLPHLRARICADCGFTEFHTENALDVYLAQTGSSPRGRAPVPAADGGASAANMQCPACGSLIPAASTRCDVCGWTAPRK